MKKTFYITFSIIWELATIGNLVMAIVEKDTGAILPWVLLAMIVPGYCAMVYHNEFY